MAESPCFGKADLRYLEAVKKSTAYRNVRKQLKTPLASDSWSDSDLAFFVFDLNTPLSGAEAKLTSVAVVVFAVDEVSSKLVAAKRVIPLSSVDVSVEDVLGLDPAYVVEVFEPLDQVM